MKHRVSVIVMLLALAVTSVWAQPAPVKKAAASVFSLTTFAKDGTILGSTHGVFTGKNGEAMAMWQPFVGADHAVAIDAKGNKHEVDVMMGISELYDVCLFRVKGYVPGALELTASDAAANNVYTVGYDLKKPVIKKLTPVRTEKFMETNNYYVFNDKDVSGNDLGCPVVNEQGQLLGIMQRPANGGQAFATDARIIKSFVVSGLSINDKTFRATGIRTVLPTDQQQAALTLMLARQQGDSLRQVQYVNDYIEMFPTATEGYTALAEMHIDLKQLAEADKTLQKEVKQAAKKDEAYYDYARLVYQSTVFKIDTTYTAWNLQKALELSEQASKVNPLPIYKHQQAQIIYAQGDYQKALDMFTQLQKTELGKNGEVFYEAAQCKTKLKAPQEEVIQLLDSAVAAQDGAISAPYVLARGRLLDLAGESRKAYMDYLKYDTLMHLNASADFYYMRYQCGVKIHQYQMALNDIAHAIVLNRFEPTYYAEMASLQVRVNQFDNAIKTCDIAIRMAPEYADLYIIKGVAACELGQKEEGLAALKKAKELGDERADKLIEKYEKK